MDEQYLKKTILKTDLLTNIYFDYFINRLLIYVIDNDDTYFLALTKYYTIRDLYREVSLQNSKFKDMFNIYYKDEISNRNIININNELLYNFLESNKIEMIKIYPTREIYKLYIEKLDKN